ncbi:S1 RNA-binding domain-containing protein [Streptomyces griseosporeus]|uniref:S1 RNA-binding domain-containing protein n=1 Tax=Streptomyces griseosporeus TaxID=1910 RepID=UPI00167CC6FA|nr:S1 RNA-binding domain-containing protein [Streptomyces griseosporeus]GHF46513.1 hypothetical protein GCM10018783_14630 [Streptomyces griseosporeus]
MIDSFHAAVECAEEALADPGGLRFAHVPSLVAFVSSLEVGTRPADWSPHELASAVRLNRLLWELGLRGEATALFDTLYEQFLGAPLPAAESIPLRNALAVVATSPGQQHKMRSLLVAALSVGGTRDPLARAVTHANLAALELSLGEMILARDNLAAARRELTEVPPAHCLEVRELLDTLEFRLGAGSRRARHLPQLDDSARAVVRKYGGNDARSFLAVADAAMARIEAAVEASDAQTLERAVGVLEVAAQRLSALLGADHPKALGLRADLAAVHIEAARVVRSAARLERAVAELATVTERLDARLGPAHPRSVAALANLVTAQVEVVRARDEPGTADRTAEALDEQVRRAGRVLGEAHPVTRLARASWLTCRRIADGEETLGGGSTLLLTLTDSYGDWATEGAVYRSYAETLRRLGDVGSGREPDWFLGNHASLVAHTLQRLYSVQAASAPRRYGIGDLVIGTVVEMDQEGAVLEVGAGYGFVPVDQYGTRREEMRIGQAVEVMVTDVDRHTGDLILSMKLPAEAWAWNAVEERYRRGEAVTGRVVRAGREGLVLQIASHVSAVLPTQLMWGQPRQGGSTPQILPGTELSAHIVHLDRRRRQVLLSRQGMSIRHRQGAAERFLTTLRRGMILPGTVSAIGPYGALVHLGRNIHGLLRSSSSSRPLVVGQMVDVEVRSIDLKRFHVSLAFKQEAPKD